MTNQAAPPNNPLPLQANGLPHTAALSVPPPPPMPSVFNPPDFLERQDLVAYRELLVRISADVKPRDVFEEIWNADIIYFQVEVLRLRRFKYELGKATIKADWIEMLIEASKKIKNNVDDTNLSGMELAAWQWLNGYLPFQEVERYLSHLIETSDATKKACAFSAKLPDLLQIDQMMTAAEKRRNGTMREIDRHRETFGRRLPGAQQDIEDVEFEVVESKSVVPAKKSAV